MGELTIGDLEQLLREGAVKLEITRGIPTWEVSPSSRHQGMVFRIQTSIEPLPEGPGECACQSEEIVRR